MDNIISIENLSKIYNKTKVVNNVSFSIKRGSVCGLLGPNGAGKTTIMKMIMNQVESDSGNICYDKDIKINYLQDVPNFYEFYSVYEYLEFVLTINKYEKNLSSRIMEVLNLLNLSNYADKKIKHLSRGLRQKVGIASVIIDEPDLLILDEPVSALDPIGRKEMIDIIKSLKGSVTIIFSSHVLTDIEKVCDHIVLISRGVIILDKPIDEAISNGKTLLIEFSSREDVLNIKDKIDVPCRFSEEIKDCLEIDSEDILNLQNNIYKLIIKEKILVKGVSIKKESLEDIFLKEVHKHV